MATPPRRIRVVGALLTAILFGSVASLAMGQGRMANPRFRRRVVTTQPVRVLPVTEDTVNVVRPVVNQDDLELRRAQARQPGRSLADARQMKSSVDAATERAQQALWHAQSARERNAVSKAGVTNGRVFGFQPRHERIADVALGSRRVVNAGHNRVINGPIVEPDAGRSGDLWYGGENAEYDGAIVGETIVGETIVDGDAWSGDLSGDVAYEYGDEVCGCSGGCFDCMGSMPPGALYGMGDLTLFVGKQGFTNGLNQGASGSFGYNEGLNFGTALPLFPYSGWGFQIGFRATQNNLSGAAQTNAERHQTFFTTGVFKRSAWGLQGGFVVDVLKDRWVGDVNLTQVRGQISWVKANVHEVGYWFAASGDSDTIAQGLLGPQTLGVTDVQGFFYRTQSASLPGATGRFLAGWSNDSDGLLAAETQIPLSARFSMLSTATYLIPKEARGNGGAQNEVWNVGINVVFSFRGAAACCSAPFAPLFRVADNGTFFVDSN